MYFVPTFAKSIQVTAGGTTATAFADYQAREVYIQADSGNGGATQIVGVGKDGTVDTAGPSLAAGAWFPMPIRVDNLNKLGYKAGASGYKLNILIVT